MLRFSLRTFLIAVTVLALIFGAEVNRLRRRKAAIASLEEVGQVVFHHQYPHSYGTVGLPADYTAQVNWPGWLRRLVGDDWFLRVQGIHVHGDADDQTLEVATNLPEVRQMLLEGNKLTNESLSTLASFRKLEMLTISAPITSIKPFEQMDWLKQLDLIDTELRKDQIGELKAALPSTRIVHYNFDKLNN